MDIIIKMFAAIVLLNLASYFMNKFGRAMKEAHEEKVMYLAEESAKEQDSILAAARKQEKSVTKKTDDPMERYKMSVTWFCRYMAECQKMAEMMERGEKVDPKRLKFSLSMVRQYKAHVLRDKQALEFDEDMSAFSVEQKFRGFELRGGRLIKDKGAKDDCVQDVARKWVKGFPNTYDAWHFEIGTLLMCLDTPLMDEYYPKEWQQRWRSGMAA